MAWTIRCQYASLAELLAEAPNANHWLSPVERTAWESMRSPSRQSTWLAGRMLAKQMLLGSFAETESDDAGVAPSEIHIASRSTSPGHGERPTVFVADRTVDCALSIAHTERGVLVALAVDPSVMLGVDLVCDEAHPDHSLDWCFTPAERRWLSSGKSQSRKPRLLWAMKEALYKACQAGEGFAPQTIEIVPGQHARYHGADAPRSVRSLQCWRIEGQHAALAVVDRLHEAGVAAEPACA